MTTPRQVTKGQKFFIIMAIFVCGLLFYANAVAFNIIFAPIFISDIITYAALTVAVSLTIITLTMVIRDKRKSFIVELTRAFKVSNEVPETPDTVSSPTIAQTSVVNEVIEKDQASDIPIAPVIAQISPIKVDSYAELLRQFSVQKTTSKLEAERAEQEKQLPKKPVIPPTKVICPACRKEFNLANYERNYIVDFGRPKQSNLIKLCPHCQTPIPLKRSGVVDDENVWKD